MSPYRRPGSPFFQIAPTVPGFGRVGPWSTGTKDRRVADAMEAVVSGLPLRGYAEVVRLLVSRKVKVSTVYVAHLENRLDAVKNEATDPKLSEVVAGMTVADARVKAGLEELLRLAPAGSRLSYLSAKHVEDLLHRRQAEGVKRNTVRRSLYRAIAEVLDRESGAAGAAAVLSEVNYPQANDERDAKLRPAQVAKLLDSTSDPLFECFMGLAVTSGIDRGPMLRIRPRDFNEQTGELEVHDTKTKARPRTLLLSKTAAGFLSRAIQLAHPGLDGVVFAWTKDQVRHRWREAREGAGLEWLRLKDLRSVFADAFVQAGGTLKDLQAVLGHSSGKTSMRYTRSQPVRQAETMEGAAKEMGFSERRRLKVEGA